MLRIFVVIFGILLLIMVSRSSFVQFMLSETQTSTIQWFDAVSTTIDNQQLVRFRNGIVEQLPNLNAPQTKYLHKITSTKIELKNFNQYYCLTGDKNPFIFGKNLQLICSEISDKGVLKNFS